MSLLSHALQFVSILLQAALIFLLLRGFLRRYLTLFCYCLAHLIATVLGEYFLLNAGLQSAIYRNFYWTAEITLDVLLFLTIIALTYRALEGNPFQRKAGQILGLIVAVVLLLPLAIGTNQISRLIHQGSRGLIMANWFNHTSQLLNFGGAIMTLVMWTALLTSRRREHQLLTVSAGVGMIVTGWAVSFGLRELFPSAFSWTDLFAAVANVAGILLWCLAFRPAARRSAPARALMNPS